MLPLIRPDLAELFAYKVDGVSEHNSSVEPDKLDANEIALDLPDWFKVKLGAIAQVEIQANRYPDGEYAQLKQTIADYVGFGVTSDQISLGNGSDELIRSLLLVTCLNRGSIMVAEPTFSMYDILAQTLGIPVVKVPRWEKDFSIDLAEAAEAIATRNIAAVWLVHPNSPTGNLLTTEEINWVRSLPENILVVIDEAYFEFSGATLVDELSQHPNWVILRTFSKAMRLAAYRVGYAIGHPDLILALEKVRLPYNLPSVSFAAAQLAMLHHDELLANVPEILTERDRIKTEIQNLGISVWHSDGNFLYLRSSSNEGDSAIASCLRSKGTVIRQTGDGLRLTIGTPEQNQRAISRLRSCLSV